MIISQSRLSCGTNCTYTILKEEVHDENTYHHIWSFLLNIIEERLYKSGQLVDLTPTEYMILQYLMDHKPVSRDEILNMIWGTNYVGETKVVDEYEAVTSKDRV